MLPLHATHADLLREAGPGKYRLTPVSAAGQRVAGLPIACTGDLRHDDDDDDLIDDDAGGELRGQRGATAVLARALARTVNANTRMARDAVGQVSGVMGQTVQLLQAAQGIGLAHRYVLPTGEVIEAGEPDESVDDEPPVAPGLHPMVEYLIDKVVHAAVPIVMGRLASGGLGVPPEALHDWRLAKPSEAVISPPPVVAPRPRSAPRARVSSPGPSFERSPTADHDALGLSVGAAPNDLGAAPAASAPPLDVQAHVLAVWQALTEAERTAASLLISHLTPDERAAWLAELATLTVADATARVRSVLTPNPTMPAVPADAVLSLPTPAKETL